MFFLHNNILGSEPSTVPLTPTHLNNITYILLQNGLYDCLYITKETESEPSMDCPDEWTYDTIFHSCFNNTTNAGNVDWSLKTVSHIIVKRRNADTFKWITIATKKINTLEDFDEGIKSNDYLNAAKTRYEYAIVPVFYGTEGIYNSAFVDSDFDALFIAEKDNIIGTLATDGFCDTTRRTPSSIAETINNKYPTYVRNTVANYDTGSCKGQFLEMKEDECDLVTDDKERIPYQRKIMDFLTDGLPKMLKHFDGRIWLISVTGDPTDTAEEVYNNRSISFEWAEIGYYESERDLYYSNLLDVEEEWWNV